MKITTWGLVAALAIGAGCTKEAPTPPPPPAVVLVPAAEKSANFDAVNRHLELGGTLYGYMDVGGDTSRLATASQTAMEQVAKIVPEMKAAHDIDFKALLQDLGISDVEALGVSSVREANGEFRDRIFIYTPHGRHGLLQALGGDAEPSHFAALAPAGVDLFEEWQMDVPALGSAIKKVWIAAAGAAAEKKAEDQMGSGGQMAGVDFLQLLRSLNGHAVLMMQVEPGKTISIPGVQPTTLPRFSVLIGIENAAPSLQGMLDKSPMLQRKEEGTRHYYTPKMPMMIDGLRPVLVVDGKTLWFSTSEFFTHQVLDGGKGPSLAQNPDYQRLEQEFGANANLRAYLTPRTWTFVKELVRDLAARQGETQGKAMEAVFASIPTPDRPQMTVLQNLPDGISYRGRLNRSFKQELLMPAIYNPLTIGALVYIAQQQAKAKVGASATAPAAPQVQLTPDQKVVRNLRMLYVVGNAYFRRSGKTEAVFEDLVGPGKMFPKLTPGEGESYEGLKIEKGQPIRITLPDGREMRYPPK